ncbi:DUF6591 domain-containing protein [Flavobacterium soyangense]|uniref:DUF6591 domain-containing protein n=1 Tax=Flavobacterium soyangense TaxID=2023265 RepID=A0A930XVI1_9FLAO|nr:DUF6591 domain-containing protein [Flavobacterium soyangense]MBF2708331.1 hypothetical protein [Flavobacterium soyangense]
MKKLIVLSCALFLLVSCKKSVENVEEPIVGTESIDTSAVAETTLENTEITSTGSQDYDKMLDDYEEYVVEYVKFYKKAMKGDTDALSEYPAMMEKATELQKSMQEAQGNDQLSMEQITRMSKIQTKMLQAMQ